MSAPDVVPVARIGDVQLAYLQSGADRFCVVSNVPGHGNALYSQATVDALQSRIDEFAEFRAEAAKLADDYFAMNSQRVALQERIDGLEKDAARMDFLEARHFGIDWNYERDHGKPTTVLMLQWHVDHRASASLRSTVDAAIKANP